MEEFSTRHKRHHSIKDTPNYFKDSNTKIMIYLTTNTTIKSDTQTTHKDSSIPMAVKLKSYRASVTLNKKGIESLNKTITTRDISTSNELKNQTIILNDIINLYSTDP